MFEINEMLVPIGTKRRKGTKLKGNNGVVIHEAGTPNAPAKNHALNQHNNANAAVNGWHITVDDKEAWLSIPLDEVAEHCGKREGNDTTVAIEIADEVTSGEYWQKAVDNAAQLAAHVLKLKGFSRAVWKENIWQHNDWNGKDCPYQIRRGNPMSFTEFVALVNQYMGAEETAPQPAPAPTPSNPATAEWEAGRNMYRGCHVELQNYMNFRTGPGENHSVIRKLYNGAELVLLENCGNGWLNVYYIDKKEQGYVSDQWIVFDSMMKGEDVRGLQKAINKHTGLDISEDAALGDKTAAGIVELQRKLGLNMDGQAGRKTVTAAGGKWTGK